MEGKFFARNGETLRIQGVTYGPFPPNAAGEHFPERPQALRDLERMRALGINSLRTYYPPPTWLLDLCAQFGISVLVDIPWSKHLCFLDSADAQRGAREAIRTAVTRGRGHAGVFAYSIANEVPPDVIRWQGVERTEQFLRELADTARQIDPECLLTYANYPPTEYLELSFLDFLTFNVYLHDPEVFSRYLMRLQNLAGERPLLLGEMGMDTLRYGEAAQAEFLAGHLRAAKLLGAAGAYVFSWTDEWFTGGYLIEDWAFGVTRADRTPKPSFFAVKGAFDCTPAQLLTRHPHVSVVVCSYNGGRTLVQCLTSLEKLDYPSYEVILVDDGSTDDTREIAARFPAVRTIHQSNQGLSAARNVGLEVATGDIVAYTDSDCFADPHWLAHLVYQFERTGVAAVGGPNLTPEDGTLAACIAASPGQPIHVLETDEIAEHIPGCNMAFRRDALKAIGGFDPVYRKAGDDVDACWRLQDAGNQIAFAPGAFVWHHRRQTPRTYLRQQAGYGEAEALLRIKHPDRFNMLGAGKWRGAYYGANLTGLRLAGRSIFRGPFATGLFQCAYQPGPAHWAMLPGSLEWHLVAVFAVMVGFVNHTWAGVAGVMFGLSVYVALLQANQARLPQRHDGWKSRVSVAALSYAQPLVRSWARYTTRFRSLCAGDKMQVAARPIPVVGVETQDYWAEAWTERTELLSDVWNLMGEKGWMRAMDTGWSEWDLQATLHPWTAVRLQTVQEEHGSGKRLIRVRSQLRPTEYLFGVVAIAAGLGTAAVAVASWHEALLAAVFGIAAGAAWLEGTRLAGCVAATVDAAAGQLGLTRCARAEGPAEGRDA